MATNDSTLRNEIFQQLQELVLIDPHTHINPHSPASTTLADILGYHYYTELAHSAGMAREHIEEPGISPKEKVSRLIDGIQPLDNTAQLAWLLEMCQAFFGFQDTHIDRSNWESLYDTAENAMSASTWEDEVLRKSGLEAVFLTNDFDDPLTGFDTKKYVPCLRTDDLVFHLAKPSVQQRLQSATGISITNLAALHQAVGKLFDHFKAHGARACAISLPPDFAPEPVAQATAAQAVDQLLKSGEASDAATRRTVSHYIFWTLTEFCDTHTLPFDLMIGVNRQVYSGGVFQGQDLYDSRVSLTQYKQLLNAFPRVTFPISVLASVTNQELVDFAWIFPNVVTSGHWWYSNTPSFIHRDLTARLEAVPRTKQIGYYSDMYKLEFALPKFNMYKRILARVLADDFVGERNWPIEKAIKLGHDLLRGNVERVFGY